MFSVAAGDSWTDRAGLHIRNRRDEGQIFGDITGQARITYNADLIAATPGNTVGQQQTTFSGIAYGTIEIFDTSITDTEPVWAGQWSHVIENGRVVSGSLLAFARAEMLRLGISYLVEDDTGILSLSGTVDHVDTLPARLIISAGDSTASLSGGTPTPPKCFPIHFVSDRYWGVECLDQDADIAAVTLETQSPYSLAWDEAAAQIIVQLDESTTIHWSVCDSRNACVSGFYSQTPVNSDPNF